MAAGKYDFIIEQGATFTRNVVWKDSSGVAVNLDGYTISGKIRRKPSDSSELVSFTCTITNASNGAFTFSLTASQTASLPVKANGENLECVYDIEASTGATVYRLLNGVCTISAEVTK